MFLSECCEIFNNIYFKQYLRPGASLLMFLFWKQMKYTELLSVMYVFFIGLRKKIVFYGVYGQVTVHRK